MKKHNIFLTFPFLFLIIVFLLEYFFIVNYINEMFQYTAINVKSEVMNNEVEQFKSYLIENFIFLILQSLGMFVCLNIGFLFFKIKMSFRKILKLVYFSLLGIVMCQFLIIVIVKLNNWTFTMGSIKSASEKLSIGNYIDINETVPWIKLSLISLNLEQLLILISLGFGISEIVKINYKRAFSITSRTYGLGIILWFIFAMVMEMNFS